MLPLPIYVDGKIIFYLIMRPTCVRIPYVLCFVNLQIA
jgi:hypothetical protein